MAASLRGRTAPSQGVEEASRYGPAEHPRHLRPCGVQPVEMLRRVYGGERCRAGGRAGASGRVRTRWTEPGGGRAVNPSSWTVILGARRPGLGHGRDGRAGVRLLAVTPASRMWDRGAGFHTDDSEPEPAGGRSRPPLARGLVAPVSTPVVPSPTRSAGVTS